MRQEINTLIELLGSENKKKIQDEITYQLIENLVESIRYEWVALPSDFNELWNNMFEECAEAVKKKYKKQITQAMSEAVESTINKYKVENNK